MGFECRSMRSQDGQGEVNSLVSLHSDYFPSKHGLFKGEIVSCIFGKVVDEVKLPLFHQLRGISDNKHN